MIDISFPGLGIDTFELDPVAFKIPIGDGIQVRWYGILITLGLVLAILYCSWRSKQEGISFDNLLDMAIFTIIFAIIGARLYYVLTSLDSFHSLYDVIAIWNGGIAIYGAIIGGAITIYCVCRYKKIKVMKAYDMVVPAVMIGQIIGRWGNFFNCEAYGRLTDTPWRMCSPKIAKELFAWGQIDSTAYQSVLDGTLGAHPTFLYESLWNLVGFVIINLLYKKKKFDGQVFLMYITWYGFGRMLIESLRTDSLYVGVFRISQVVGFVCFVVGGVLLIVNLTKARKAALAEGDYTPSFMNTSLETAAENDKDIKEEEASPNATEDTATPIEENETDISDKLKNLFSEDE